MLRKKENDIIKISAKNGIFRAAIKNITSNSHLNVIEEIETDNNVKIKINLYQALCQQKKMDLIVQKATELGVYSITPVISKRSKVKLESEIQETKKLNRLKEIAINACQQSHNNVTPKINKITNINNILIKSDDLSIALHPGAEYTLSSFESPEQESDINVFIGPEGGFDQNEIKTLEQIGVTLVKFGPRILRTETAAISIIAVLNSMWGDCN